LALDFTTGALDARVAVARASNTATAVNSSGYVATVNANLPRFDYDPVTLACKGLLIEEARTNLTPYSADYSTWGNVFAGVTANQGTSPDGLNNASKIVPNNGQVSSWISQVGIPASTGTYTLTVYAKAAGLTAFRMGFFNVTDGDRFAVYTLSGSGAVASSSAGTTASIQNAGNGWYRCVLTYTVTGTVSAQIQIARLSSGTGDGVNGWLVWGAQLEAGAFATSYIPTVASQVTRNPDLVTMTGTNFSSWYNASEGAFNLWANVYSDTAPTMLELSKTGSGYAELFVMAREAALDRWQTEVVAGGAVQSVLNPAPNTFTINANHKCVFAYKSASYAAAADGSAVATSAGSVPTGLDRLSIGHDLVGGGNFMNGYVQKLQYWPQRLIDAEVQAFSK
jgi:hypothetical protein